ncbi:MAG: hypothetical protein ACPLYD_11370 [Anaerolineae bacterium]
MKTIPAQARMQIAAQDNTWVEEARMIAKSLWTALGKKGEGKERQLRNIQSVAEESNSWAALALFIRYQAARGEIPKQWAEETVTSLERLQRQAKELTAQVRGADDKVLHMEIVSRVLGYAVRWHVWDVKGLGKEESR